MSGKVAWWTVMLSEFDLHYMSQKSIKGRTISNFLANLTTEDQQKEHSDLPDKEILYVDEDLWMMYFDRASH